MKLLFDLVATQSNVTGKRHGGGRYGEVILLRMLERGLRFGCFYDSGRWLNPAIKEACERSGVAMHDVHGTSVEEIVRAHGYTRLYSCLPMLLENFPACEIYGTIHGLRELESPFDRIFYSYRSSWKEWMKFTLKKTFLTAFHGYKRQQYVSRCINTPFHLITVSEHSRYAFLAYFPDLEENRINVFYSPNTSSKTPAVKEKTDERYFLAVSGDRWDKNVLRAIQAFDRLVSANRLPQNVRMKITGAKSENYKYKPQNLGRFDFLGYVADAELEKLYANAYLFVYPSLNEGFGYPPIEAMRYGVPVIASPLSSIAETCGSGALFFDPYSVEEIMNRMMMMMDPAIHEEYSGKASRQHAHIKARQERDLDGLIDYITSEK